VLLKNINLSELNISEHFNIFQLAVGGTPTAAIAVAAPTGHCLITKYNFNSTTRYLEQKQNMDLVLKVYSDEKDPHRHKRSII